MIEVGSGHEGDHPDEELAHPTANSRLQAWPDLPFPRGWIRGPLFGQRSRPCDLLTLGPNFFHPPHCKPTH